MQGFYVGHKRIVTATRHGCRSPRRMANRYGKGPFEDCNMKRTHENGNYT